MKAVKGEVISSNAISLSKAAAVISRFAASETGARPEVVACLKRSVTAFKDLVDVNRQIRVDEKEGEIKDEDDSCLIKKKKKKKKKKKRSFLEGEMDGGSKKVEALGSEKKVEERRNLVSESLNIERKKRRNFDGQEGEVNGEMKKGEGKMKKRRRVIDKKVEAFDYEKKSEERRNLVSESLNIERKKRRNLDAQEGEVSGEMKKLEGKKKKRRRVIE